MEKVKKFAIEIEWGDCWIAQYNGIIYFKVFFFRVD